MSQLPVSPNADNFQHVEHNTILEQIPFTHIISAHDVPVSTKVYDDAGPARSDSLDPKKHLLLEGDRISDVLNRFTNARGDRPSVVWHLNSVFTHTVKSGIYVVNRLSPELTAYATILNVVCCDPFEALLRIRVWGWAAPGEFVESAGTMLGYLVTPLARLGLEYGTEGRYFKALRLPEPLSVNTHVYKSLEAVLALIDNCPLPDFIFDDPLSKQILCDYLYCDPSRFFGTARNTGIVYIEEDGDRALGDELAPLPAGFRRKAAVAPWHTIPRHLSDVEFLTGPPKVAGSPEPSNVLNVADVAYSVSGDGSGATHETDGSSGHTSEGSW